MAERRFIPETPEALTADWLNDVLAPADPVQSLTQTVLGEGEGLMGDILRLTLSRASGATDSLVAKLPKLENRTIGELLGAYEREILFYQNFGDTLPVRCPKLLYADFDRDRGSENQEVILRKADALPRWTNAITTRLGRWIAASKKRRYLLLIEDVGGAEPGNQVAGASRERCRAVLEQMAKLHAAYWNDDRLKGQFWLLPMDVDMRMRHSMSVQARPAFDALFPESAARLAPYLDEGREHGIEHTQQLAAGPTTLLHHDLRLDNLMFEGEEVIFIDWQLVRRGHPAYDLAYFLSSAVTDEGSAEELINHYHQALCGNGVSGYSRAQLHNDYATALRVVAMSLSSVDQVDVGDGRGRELLSGWMHRLANRLAADG